MKQNAKYLQNSHRLENFTHDVFAFSHRNFMPYPVCKGLKIQNMTIMEMGQFILANALYHHVFWTWEETGQLRVTKIHKVFQLHIGQIYPN